ncbi:hypothetical protein H2O64_04585 [Kordia sp. YSTF-M3]|uniref:GGDEF domain-containing protein n=1 Tax=Kordia aestuariivivens TaxID=2759037 RepID=A0ABR7Q5V1_9FLAO|nr:hypothetical protein [Kordia aestuariivivens]MBC8753935.1 hypothetical protein [Kordia aestuariivivens]
MNNYYYGISIYSIQEFIFETNKLREIVGASEIVETVCKTQFQQHFKAYLTDAVILLQAAGNVRCIFSITDNDLPEFKECYAKFTKKLTLAYPELKFCQAIHSLPTKEITQKEVTALNATIVSKKQQPFFYNRLAFMGVKRNQRTGKIQSNTNTHYDLATTEKDSYKDGKLLLKKLEDLQVDFPKELDDIASEQSYMALIHIDANGLGNIVNAMLKENNGSSVLKSFSLALEAATINALKTAIKETFPIETAATAENKSIPFRPVIIGGDDITIIIKAEKALKFTEVYLTTFEAETEKIKQLKDIGLTACAGIAFTKQKFPLHYTADLVENLCKSAKEGSNRKYSAIRMHRVRNTYARDYDRIIETELSLNGESAFYNEKPFSIEELIQFQKDVAETKADKFPRADVENYLSQRINGNPQAAFMKRRMLAKLPKSESAFIKNMENEPLDLPYLYALTNLQKFIDS